MAALAIPIATTILGGIAGALGKPTSNVNTTTGSSTSTSGGYQNTEGNSNTQAITETQNKVLGTQVGTTTGTSTPTMSPEATRFMNQLISQYSTLARPVNLAPYAAQQTQQINRNSDLQNQAVRNAMAARGLSTSPVSGTAEANIQAGRVGQITNLLESIPLLLNQLQQSNLGSAASFFSTLPRGMSTTGTSQSNTSQDTIGSNKVDSNTATSGNSNYYNTGQTQGTQTSTSTGSSGGGLGGAAGGIGATAGGLAPVIAKLFG